MKTLPAPDAALARRLLEPVPYAQRLPAGRFLPPVGILPGDVRGLAEAHEQLAPDDRSLPGVNLHALARWVGEVLGDGDLAGLIAEAAARAPSYVVGCIEAYALIGERLAQARHAAGKEDQG